MNTRAGAGAVVPRLRVLRVYHSAVVSVWRQRERELIELGCEVRTVGAHTWNEGGRPVRLETDGDDFVVAARTWGAHPYRFVYDPRPIIRELRARRVDVLDVHEEPASLAALELRILAWLFQRRVPIVFYGAQNIEKRFPIPFRWIERGSLRRAAGAHVCNVEAGEIFAKKGLRGEIATIGLGVDVELFAPRAGERRPGPFRVGYFGRLEAHKGVDVLLTALAELPDVELLVYGDGPMREQLEAQAARGAAGRVTFAGFVAPADMPDAYRSVDLVVVPSIRTTRWVEQFGRVAVEAMASGVPVIATDDGALRDVVGGAGLLVPGKNPSVLLDEIARVRTSPDLHAALCAHGLERAQQYRWRSIAEAQLKLYEAAAPRTPPTSRAVRVVYLDHTARLSGAELALARVMPALLALGVQAHVILGEDGPLVGELRALGAEVGIVPFAARDLRRDRVQPRRLPIGSVWLTARYVLQLRKRLRALQPDLVHTNSLKAALYGGVAGRLARVPVLWHIRDRIADDYLPTPAVKLVRLLARWVPTAIVTNSQATLDTLGDRVRPATVAPSPVVMDAVGGIAVPHATAGPFTVAIIGRLSPWKGQHVFLDAFARAFADSDTRAVLVGSAMFGEDAYEQQLRAQCTRLGLDDRVEFLGFRRDVFEVLAGVDVLVHASTVAEPFGQVIIEGMAAGVPVIATAAGGPLEIITDGVDGVLVAPDDVEALAAAMQRMATDTELRSRLATNGRERAGDFTPERVAAQLHEVYMRVMR